MPSDGDSSRGCIVVVDECVPAGMVERITRELGRRVKKAIAVAWSAWLLGAGALMLQRWTSSGERISAGSVAGSVRVRGSWAPLVLMLTIFLVNYTVAVALAIRPHLAAHAVFATTACGLFGASSGYFLGQLARDLAAWRRMLSLHPDASELGTT